MKYCANLLGPEGYGSYWVDWSQGQPTLKRTNTAPDRLLIPGFIDLHIHGAYGIDFMTADKSDMGALCAKLRKAGYEGFLPTTVSASADAVKNALGNLPDHEMILGFHLEGPFISPEFPGAQPVSAIVDPPIGDSPWDAIFDDPRLRVITLAPERPHALSLISRLNQRGVIVSMGHTNATYDEARFGFEFGAAHATHTFNAMRAFHHREAGAVGYILSNPTLKAELIYDRIHVCRESAALLLQAKGQDGVIAVSDSSAATGMPNGHRQNMWGHEAVVFKKSVRIAGTDTLAGSAIHLLDAFQAIATDFGVETAIRLCCINPRRALGITSMPRVYCELDPSFAIKAVREVRN